ncbi:MAG: thiamine phosphate synthase [Lachnospiraceae bacterium]|nr:thiamine phosphate synthase [Lachnospiraceae bacterium]
MSTCKIICVSSRKLAEDFPAQLARVARAGVDGIILREKDLDEAEYEELAAQVKAICGKYGVPLTLHTYGAAALRLGIRRLHLPLRMLLAMEEAEKRNFDVLGASIHAPEEAVAAEAAGAAYVTAGHIFATDCKKGLSPRGIPFLKEVCKAVHIPVYAIGGITLQNAPLCSEAGAAGVCLMSSLMHASEEELLDLVSNCKKNSAKMSIAGRRKL